MKYSLIKLLITLSLVSNIFTQWYNPWDERYSKTDGINIFYIFDTSGSFYDESLPTSINLANQIYKDFSEYNIYPQVHQFSTISEIWGKTQNCVAKIEAPSLIDNTKNKIDYSCLNQIKKHTKAKQTDISGAIKNASASLQGDKYRGKAIIIFSDFDETAHLKFNSRLDDIIVYAVHDYSEIQINNKSYDKDIAEFKTMLMDKGCKEENIKIVELRSFINNPSDAIRYLEGKFH